MLIRLLPTVMLALLPALCCRAGDLSERVLFSGRHADSRALESGGLIPDISELGFDEEGDYEDPVRPDAEAAGTRDRGPERAYASMVQPEDAAAAASPVPPVPEFDAVPSGDLPPLLLEDAVAGGGTVSSPYPARRGLRVRAGGELLRARQEASLLDPSAYSMTGTKYSVSLDCDWSVDTVLGLSLDMLDATVKSGQPFDSRQADISGVFAGASMDSVLFDSYLVGFKGFYGWLDSAGSGSVGALDDGGATVHSWREPEHSSGMYGLSASIRVPVLIGDCRVVFDAGAGYKRIDTGSYAYRLSGARDSTGNSFSSTSFAFPAGFSAERDFVTRWALFTPRLGAGYSHEFSDSASGVRSLNALSAVPLHLQANGFHSALSGLVSPAKGMYRFTLGLDVATAGGWNMALDYRRDFAAGYHLDNFSMELGRSF